VLQLFDFLVLRSPAFLTGANEDSVSPNKRVNGTSPCHPLARKRTIVWPANDVENRTGSQGAKSNPAALSSRSTVR
jgi:hypothetical protein